jgi:hypothetical protein
MAGVFGQLLRSQTKAMHRSDPKALELETAKEILAEVFGIRTSEVEEMLRQRSEVREEWPERFCIEAE